MAENDVTIQINVEAKDAQAAIELFGKESVKVLNNVEKSNTSLYSSIKGAAVPITAAIGTITAAYALLSGAIEEANADAKLTRQIAASLLATGESGKEAVQGVLDFADSIKEATGLSDDLAKQTFITAKSFGISTEQAKKLTAAAIDLASATGIDVETAVRQLGGTLDGSIGKIGNLGAEFRNLTEAQAKAGDAIDLVSQKFGGTAAKDLDTYEGSTNKLKNSYDDLLKAIGRTATESESAKAGFSGLATFIDNLTGKIEAFRKGTLEITGANIVRGTGSIEDLKLLKEELGALQGVDFGKTSKEIASGFAGIIESEQGATKATADFEDRLKSFQANVVKSSSLTGRALEEATKKSVALATEGKKFVDSVLSQFGSKSETEANKASQAILGVEEQFKKQTISFKKSMELKLLIAEDFNRKVAEDNKKADKEEAERAKASAEKAKAEAIKAAEDTKAQLEKIANSPIEFFFRDESKSGQAESLGIAIAGGFNSALSGKNGALKFVSDIGAKFASEAFGPAFGPVIGSIIGKLAAGPEQAKAFVKEFIIAIPDIIVAIVDALPEAISAIVETIFSPEFLSRLGLAMGKSFLFIVTAGLNKFAPEWGAKIAEAFGPELQRYLDVSIEKFSQVFTMIGTELRAFVEALKQPFEPLIAAIKSLESALTKASGEGVSKKASEIGSDPLRLGRAIATGGLSEILPAIGVNFAKGGIVPMYAADGAFVPRGTDTVPAMLTPGELVIPRDMVGELSNFLARQSSTTGSDPATLAAILTAVQAPMIVTAEAKVNQNAFADIILQLNRQNMRLQA